MLRTCSRSDFATAIDRFFKQHLFCALFARDNLDWQSREIATVSMLAATTGVQSQLQSHIRISLNRGLTLGQLTEIGRLLAEQVSAEAVTRVLSAIRQMGVKSLPEQAPIWLARIFRCKKMLCSSCYPAGRTHVLKAGVPSR